MREGDPPDTHLDGDGVDTVEVMFDSFGNEGNLATHVDDELERQVTDERRNVDVEDEGQG